MLIQRVASAVVGVPIIIAVIWIGGNVYVGVVAAALAIASLEFTHFRRAWFDPISVLTALFIAGTAVGAHGDTHPWWLLAVLIVPPLAAAANPTDDAPMMDAAWSAGGVIYLGYLGSALVLLRDVADGREWMYLTLLATFATDTAAYFTGRAIGRHKLAPRISPKKTIEGFVGGWIAGAAAVAGLAYLFDLAVDPARIALLAVAFPIAATAGDLLESGIKRLAGVKDASALIPGHGGVLDRLDAILLTASLVYLFLKWVA